MTSVSQATREATSQAKKDALIQRVYDSRAKATATIRKEIDKKIENIQDRTVLTGGKLSPADKTAMAQLQNERDDLIAGIEADAENMLDRLMGGGKMKLAGTRDK